MRTSPSHLVTIFVTFSHIENEIVKEKRQIVISRWGAVLAGNRFFQEIISGGKRVPEQHQFLTLWHQNSFYILADESKIHLFPEQALSIPTLTYSRAEDHENQYHMAETQGTYKQREATERIISPFSHYLTIPAS